MNEILSTIKTRLEALAIRDKDLQIFGADGHKYKSTPVSLDEIEAFEARHNIRLPEQYRDFLLYIGYGAGPYYGIWSLEEVQEEIDDTDFEYLREEKPITSQPFPLTEIEAAESLKRLYSGDKKPWIPAPYFCNGMIRICSEGCAFWNALIISGDLSGSVWFTGEIYGSRWLPARGAVGLSPRYAKEKKRKQFPPLPTLPTFYDWYIRWLERCEADLDLLP